jgi:alpha-glucuronidase
MKRKLLKNTNVLALLLLVTVSNVRADNGYKLWLEYSKLTNQKEVVFYQQKLSHLIFPATSAMLKAAQAELQTGLNDMLSLKPEKSVEIINSQTLVIGTPQSLKSLAITVRDSIGDEGYLIKTTLINKRSCILITAKTDIGVMYGVFNF